MKSEFCGRNKETNALALLEKDCRNEKFLHIAYGEILGRTPDESAVMHYSSMFSLPERQFRLRVISDLAHSEEARQKGKKIVNFPDITEKTEKKSLMGKFAAAMLPVYRHLPEGIKNALKRGMGAVLRGGDVHSENKETVPECDLVPNETESECDDVFSSLSKENGTVEAVKLVQLVVLTARNDDIMKSLPYIEAYMPFIEELVVCCPPQNVQPFREKYKGRLRLSFITDDELLGGEALPADHQARNFFLRCRLMRQEKLRDVFIMTDDDYRPMKPLTQEVFLKDGRYRGYYFYDLRDWQGTYNNYTSFDKGAFATRDFLLEKGYKTLQYSSHQPQVIDRRIFLEMLDVHKDIEKMPLDEWSTYFNFGFCRHPDKFLPCESVSMCWPGDLASWDIHHVPGEYLFENYYEELYGEGGMFEGFSRTFCENTESENIEKAGIYREKSLLQTAQRSVFEKYRREYAESMGILPSIVLFYDDISEKPRLTLPGYARLAYDSWTRFPLAIDSQVYRIFQNHDIFISYHYINSHSVPVLNSPDIPIKTGDTRIMLPLRTPKAQLGCNAVDIRFTIKEKGSGKTVRTEKSMKLMLVSTDEVEYV
ncbi:MAG: hypothetical protein ACI4JN_02800 [Ruminococcus sp.]